MNDSQQGEDRVVSVTAAQRPAYVGIALLHFAEDVAGRDVVVAEVLDDLGALGALAAAYSCESVNRSKALQSCRQRLPGNFSAPGTASGGGDVCTGTAEDEDDDNFRTAVHRANVAHDATCMSRDALGSYTVT